jgi:glycosyltransferase involved in cell wall biosynthesis
MVDIVNKVMVPDQEILWLPFALKSAKKIFWEHKIDAVLSTHPKATSHLVAYFLSKNYNIPMIADFRDPWTQGKIESARPFPFRNFDLLLEKTVIKHSAKVISVTEEINNDFIRRYPYIENGKFNVVTNGYDRGDFNPVQPHKYKNYTIVYTGRDYDGQGNLEYFLKVLNEIRRKCQIDIYFHYIGSDYERVASYTTSFKDRFVKTTPFLPHGKAIAYMKGANALYVNQPEERLPALTTKIFEYICVQRPIIAITKNGGEMDRVIKKSKAGFTYELGEEYNLEEFLKSEYANYCKGKSSRLQNEKLIGEYDRKQLASKIASIIRNVAKV